MAGQKAKLIWKDGFAHANGWEYAIQTERPHHEPRWSSLLLKPPWLQYRISASQLVDHKVPDVRGREGTRDYVKRQAQAHADLVAQQ